MSPSTASSSKKRSRASDVARAEPAQTETEKYSKKPKSSRFHFPSDNLNWKAVKAAPVGGFDEGGGMMMLEELDDVGVEWEEGMNGQKTARFIEREPTSADAVDQESLTSKSKAKQQKKVKGKGKGKAAAPITKADSDEDEEEAADEEESEGVASEEQESAFPTFAGLDEEDMNEEDEDHDADGNFDDSKLPEWKAIDLNSTLKRAIFTLDFLKPTDIQARSLPSALQGRDIVGVAETGSGKTLAYSLPVLSYLLDRPAPRPSVKRPLSALILCPTRELAIQVVDHLNKVVAHATTKTKGPPRISIGSVVGGLSAQKQKRIVERGCDILVATPGRLWDLIKSDDDLAAGVRGMRFLIVDEADRMIETGHFAELENIVRLTERQPQAVGPDEDDPVFANASTLLSDTEAREDMQTFVFSATLSKDLQNNLKRRQRTGGKKNHKKASALEDLVERLDFRDEKPEVIDLSPEGGVVKALQESMIDCVLSEKDLYLYYFLLRYPGRSLVFVGSIDGIRRLTPLFEVLQVPVYPLHSQLQQKQRLKNLDRFKTSKNGVLIATDVAARGLDIPQVEHVIHFNLPRTADAYIHRSGRTARAQKPGFALLLCSAEEKGIQRALMKSLNRTTEIPELAIDSGFLPKLKERIKLAKDIEKAQHLVKKENHERNWLKEAAEAMDVDIDPSLLSDPDDPDLPYQRKKNTRPGKTINPEALKAELKALLREPLMARGVSARYPTSGSKVIIDDLLGASGHGTLLGASTAKAHEESASAKKRPLKKKPIKAAKPSNGSKK